jgi:hypothetical protein
MKKIINLISMLFIWPIYLHTSERDPGHATAEINKILALCTRTNYTPANLFHRVDEILQQNPHLISTDQNYATLNLEGKTLAHAVVGSLGSLPQRPRSLDVLQYLVQRHQENCATPSALPRRSKIAQNVQDNASCTAFLYLCCLMSRFVKSNEQPQSAEFYKIVGIIATLVPKNPEIIYQRRHDGTSPTTVLTHLPKAALYVFFNIFEPYLTPQDRDEIGQEADRDFRHRRLPGYSRLDPSTHACLCCQNECKCCEHPRRGVGHNGVWREYYINQIQHYRQMVSDLREFNEYTTAQNWITQHNALLAQLAYELACGPQAFPIQQ